MNHKLASSVALAAATLFLAACNKGGEPTKAPEGASPGDAAKPPADLASDAKVNCFGINECSGQSACDVAGSHECAGQNSCRGKGWISIPKSECDSKGGKIVG